MKENNKKSIIVSFSFPVSYLKRVKSIAIRRDLSASDIVRRAIDLFELQEEKNYFGRYGGIKIGQAKTTKLMRETEREEKIKALQEMSPAQLESHLIEISYFPAEGIDERNEIVGTYRRHQITPDKEYIQITYNEDGSESYRRPVFNFDELIADLKKQKKI